MNEFIIVNFDQMDKLSNNITTNTESEDIDVSISQSQVNLAKHQKGNKIEFAVVENLKTFSQNYKITPTPVDKGSISYEETYKDRKFRLDYANFLYYLSNPEFESK